MGLYMTSEKGSLPTHKKWAESPVSVQIDGFPLPPPPLRLNCEAQKPGGLLTTRQPAEDSWMSGNLTPHHRVPFSGTHDLTKIGQSLFYTGSFTQNTTCTKKLGNMAKYNTMTSLGPIMSESGLTKPHYIIYRTNYHSS